MKVKICGITNLDDARHAAACGADSLGFNFYPPSPRYVAPDVARDIIAELPAAVDKVGVFVNASAEEMLELARHCGLTTLQLHGDEPPELARRLRPFPVIKALAVAEESDLQRLETFSDCTLLLDTPCAGYGGSGQTGDWRLARCAAERWNIYLAGGLTPANVAEAIRQVQPYGVDAASGVERAKGLKDADGVRRFIALAKEAAGAL